MVGNNLLRFSIKIHINFSNGFKVSYEEVVVKRGVCKLFASSSIKIDQISSLIPHPIEHMTSFCFIVLRNEIVEVEEEIVEVYCDFKDALIPTKHLLNNLLYIPPIVIEKHPRITSCEGNISLKSLSPCSESAKEEEVEEAKALLWKFCFCKTLIRNKGSPLPKLIFSNERNDEVNDL